jgi:small subunit ribosomal protein S21
MFNFDVFPFFIIHTLSVYCLIKYNKTFYGCQKLKKFLLFIVKQKKNMLIIPVNNKNIEQALKAYKFKIYKTKQIQKLQERKEYKKPSVERRAQIQKAIYNQKNYSAD